MAENFILKVYGLGDFRVEIGDKKLRSEDWKSKKALKLFKYLLINFNTFCNSEKIIDKLWPDCDLEIGKRRLYDTVYQLRKMIDTGNKSYIKKTSQ